MKNYKINVLRANVDQSPFKHYLKVGQLYFMACQYL